jgi:hypothetical protein
MEFNVQVTSKNKASITAALLCYRLLFYKQKVEPGFMANPP